MKTSKKRQRSCFQQVSFLTVVVLGYNATPSFAAAQIQSLDTIRSAVHAFLLQGHHNVADPHLDIIVGRLDPRLRLPECSTALDVFSLHKQRALGNTTVGVRCHQAKPWTLYVPVTINRYAEVLALAAPLPKGTVLKKSHLVPTRHNIATLTHGYFSDMSDVVGLQLRQPTRAGEILSPHTVTAPTVVERGQQVMLIAESDTIAVIMKGEALQDGRIGDRIQVRNTSSRRVVEAEVVNSTLVKVAM